jgi:hypothetical protein
MKPIKTERFTKKNPETISFEASPIQNNPPVKKKKENKQEIKKVSKPVNNKEINKTIKQESNKVSNITILQFFNEEDIKNLREPAYTAQTFRLRNEDIDKIKDLAYSISKEMNRKKVTQADITRISFHLFSQLWEKNKKEVKELLEKIKE